MIRCKVRVEAAREMRTAQELLRRGRDHSLSPVHDFRLSRRVGLPTLHVDLTYSQLMEGVSEMRCTAGSSSLTSSA